MVVKDPVLGVTTPWEAELPCGFLSPFPIYKKQPTVIQVTEATPLCYWHDPIQPSEGEFQILSVILCQRTSVILEELKKKKKGKEKKK